MWKWRWSRLAGFCRMVATTKCAKRIARKLLHSARDGTSTLSDFMKVARSALRERRFRKSAQGLQATGTFRAAAGARHCHAGDCGRPAHQAASDNQ
jgi:hypothetical protein